MGALLPAGERAPRVRRGARPAVQGDARRQGIDLPRISTEAGGDLQGRRGSEGRRRSGQGKGCPSPEVATVIHANPQTFRGGAVVRMLKNTAWLALTLSLAVTGLGHLRAQQTPAGPTRYPQLPQPYFRALEDTSKFGLKPDEIKAGERPDYQRIPDPLELIPVQGAIHLVGGGGGNVAVQL